MTTIRIQIGDHSLESAGVGLKIGRRRPVVVDGRRTYVLAEPVSYFASLRDALNGIGKKIRRGEIKSLPIDVIETLADLRALIEASREDVAQAVQRLEGGGEREAWIADIERDLRKGRPCSDALDQLAAWLEKWAP